MSCSIVFGQYGFHHGLLGDGFTTFGFSFTFALKIVDMKTQHISVFNGVSDGVHMQLFLKYVCCGFIRCQLSLDHLVSGVVFKDGGTGKTKELSVWEKFFNCLVVFTKLRAMAFIKDEHNPLL